MSNQLYQTAIGPGVRQSSANWTPYDAGANLSSAVNLGVREVTRRDNPLYVMARNGILPAGQRFRVGMEIEYDEWNDDIVLHARQDNARPKIQTMGMTRKKCRIGEEAEYFFKLSKHDADVLRSGEIGQDFNGVVNRFRESAGRAAKKYAFKKLVNDIIRCVSCDNYGPNAGALYHNTNTGSFVANSAPIVIDQSNVDWVPATIASLAHEQGIGGGQTIGLLNNSNITMFADPRFGNLLQHSDYTKDLLAGNCPDACRLRGMGYQGQEMNGVAINITTELPMPKNRDGKQWGYVIGVVNGACVFEGFNETFQIMNGDSSCPGDMFGYGTYAFGHAVLERAAVFVLCVEYNSASPFASS